MLSGKCMIALPLLKEKCQSKEHNTILPWLRRCFFESLISGLLSESGLDKNACVGEQ